MPLAITNSMDSLYGKLTGSFLHFDENMAEGLGKTKGEVTFKIQGEPEIKTCKYCSCTYYAGTVGTCIHCGAPLEV